MTWVARLGGLLVRGLARTWRIRESNSEPVRTLRAAGQPIIFVLWHGRLLPLLWHHRKQGITVLISEHADGELIARVAHGFGFATVRGSTTRGAHRSLLGMIRALERGSDVAFTPDGPRGPAETFTPGALIAAQRSGAPIVAVAGGSVRAWRLRSWDRFLIPKPFARVTVSYGDPVFVRTASPREATADAPRLEGILRETSARSDA